MSDSSLRWHDSFGAKKRKRPDNGGSWKGKRSGKDKDQEDAGDCSDDASPSGGSIPMEEIKQTEEYKRKVTFTDAPKRKYALAVAYLGTAYRGLQINPGILTVEAELEKALFLAGGIEEVNFGEFHKVSWSRAGRTDKGVHAVTNCCSMKLSIPLDQEESFVESVNSFLPADIRVLTMTKTIKNFNAKIYCSGRLYHYMLPTFVLSKVDAVDSVVHDLLSCINSADETTSDSSSSNTLSRERVGKLRAALKDHRLTAEDLAYFRSILTKFQGTHKFHNFTSDKNPSDASASRFIISVECSDPILFPGNPVEWVCVSLRGQSFLLNQIRKMIGLSIDVFRGEKDVDVFSRCFEPKEKIDILMAPGLGLYLKELFFERYHVKLDVENDRNERMKQNLIAKGKPVTDAALVFSRIEWSSTVPEQIESFEKNVVWPHICEQEELTLGFAVYLDLLRARGARSVAEVAEGGDAVVPSGTDVVA